MEEHITLRLPRALARTLARWARTHGIPRSQVVREAVVRYLEAGPAGRHATVTASEVATAWASLPRLTAEEADAMAHDMERARTGLPGVRPATWE